MNTTKTFDCVEFQRKVRYQHYLDANGDVDIMINNMKERINDNELWKKLVQRKEKQNS